ncbi:MAG TPA: hypothetical protein VGX94_02475 [Terriglobia bacterium]|nr:hypothetical protein [Terriglobia bacterium]
MNFENYFNYFTEIENCFRRQRGAPLLLSTLDWALIESWKEAGIPLEAVCEGIERTFEKRARRPRRFTKVNGLAFCTQEVMLAADRAATAAVESGTGSVATAKSAQTAPPFAPEQLIRFLTECAIALDKAAERTRAAGDERTAADLEENAQALRHAASKGELSADLEALERTLTAIEDRLFAGLTRGTPVEQMVLIREEVDRSLAACRRQMTAVQIESVERQFLKKRLFEHYQLPRLSLFYL